MDVHIARAVTSQLRAYRINVLTAQEDGAAELADPDLLDRATSLGRVLFSQDKDFLVEATRRQQQGIYFFGVIFSKQNLPVGICVQDLSLMAFTMQPEEFKNRLHYLPL